MNQHLMSLPIVERIIGMEAAISDAALKAGCPRPYDIPFAIGWMGEMSRIAVEYLGVKKDACDDPR